jgi:hypothetical protein
MHTYPRVGPLGAALLHVSCSTMPKPLCVDMLEADPVDAPVPCLLLHVAASLGDADTCAEVLASGADARFATRKARGTALHAAAEHGHVRCASALLAAGADAAAVDAKGATPLSLATEAGHTDVARLLRTHAANAGTANSGKAAAPPAAGARAMLDALDEYFFDDGGDVDAMFMAMHGDEYDDDYNEADGRAIAGDELDELLREQACGRADVNGHWLAGDAGQRQRSSSSARRVAEPVQQQQQLEVPEVPAPASFTEDVVACVLMLAVLCSLVWGVRRRDGRQQRRRAAGAGGGASWREAAGDAWGALVEERAGAGAAMLRRVHRVCDAFAALFRAAPPQSQPQPARGAAPDAGDDADGTAAGGGGDGRRAPAAQGAWSSQCIGCHCCSAAAATTTAAAGGAARCRAAAAACRRGCWRRRSGA